MLQSTVKQTHNMKNFIALTFIILLQACDSNTIDVEAIVIANNEKWVNNYNSGNAKEIADLHTIDAVVIPPHADFVVGREAIQKMYEDEIEMGKGTLDLKTLEVLHQGHYAYETGLYDIQMTVDQELIQDNGKYIVVWERQSDGKWLCKKDIWNTNLERP